MSTIKSSVESIAHEILRDTTQIPDLCSYGEMEIIYQLITEHKRHFNRQMELLNRLNQSVSE